MNADQRQQAWAKLEANKRRREQPDSIESIEEQIDRAVRLVHDNWRGGMIPYSRLEFEKARKSWFDGHDLTDKEACIIDACLVFRLRLHRWSDSTLEADTNLKIKAAREWLAD